MAECKITPISNVGSFIEREALPVALGAAVVGYWLTKDYTKDEWQAQTAGITMAVLFGGVPFIAGYIMERYGKSC